VTTSEWWEPFSDAVPRWFSRYLSVEPSASLIRCYEAQFLPGLFQTAAYARAVIGLTHTDPAAVERRVDLRQARQRLLDRAHPPTVRAVISEDALTRPPMTPGQRREQLDRLVALMERPHITIAILTSAQAATVNEPSFTIISFSDSATPDLVYIEEPDDAQYLTDPADITHYEHLLADLSATGSTGDEARAVLSELRARWTAATPP
jgi:hypothetical protein